MNVTTARAILKEHGIDPDAGAKSLMAALAARGWRVTVEEPSVQRGPHVTAQACRHRDRQEHGHYGVVRETVWATGPSRVVVLRLVLARALKREPWAWILTT